MNRELGKSRLFFNHFSRHGQGSDENIRKFNKSESRILCQVEFVLLLKNKRERKNFGIARLSTGFY